MLFFTGEGKIKLGVTYVIVTGLKGWENCLLISKVCYIAMEEMRNTGKWMQAV